MATLEEIVANRQAYPDDTTWDVGGGVTVKLKDLRDTLIPKGEMTRMTQAAAEEKRQYQQKLQQYEAQMTEMARRATMPAPPSGTDPLQPYLDDPTFGPLAKQLREVAENQKAIMQQTRQHEQVWWAQQHLNTIEKLKSQDKDLDDQKIQGLIGFAKQHGLANLDHAYRLMTDDTRIKRAADEAEKRGYDKAKAEPPPPPIPAGRVAATSPNAPKSFEEAKQAARAEPEIMRGITPGMA